MSPRSFDQRTPTGRHINNHPKMCEQVLIYILVIIIFVGILVIFTQQDGTRLNIFSMTRQVNITEVNPKLIETRGVKTRKNRITIDNTM